MKMAEFKYVTIGDDFVTVDDVAFEATGRLTVAELKAMAVELDAAAKEVAEEFIAKASETATLFTSKKEAVRDELQRRRDEALEALRDIEAVAATADTGEPGKRKRWRKSKAEAEAAKAAEFEQASEEMAVAMDA
jgi:hypothetical protein